jgi:hypothetical protein
VKAGARYGLSAHQISGVTRSIIGSFQVDIPVSRAPLIVREAERDLTVLRQISLAIPKGNRWEPVFARYLDALTGRVIGLGGDPSVSPEPKPPGPGGKRVQITGKVGRIFYDCFGDFEGFDLEDCDECHHFRSRERPIEEVIHRACRERMLVMVSFDPDFRRILRIAIQCG